MFVNTHQSYAAASSSAKHSQTSSYAYAQKA